MDLAAFNAVINTGTLVTLLVLAGKFFRWTGSVDTKLDHLWQEHEQRHHKG